MKDKTANDQKKEFRSPFTVFGQFSLEHLSYGFPSETKFSRWSRVPRGTHKIYFGLDSQLAS